MAKQKLDIMIGVVVDNDRWIPLLPEIQEDLEEWLQTAVQEKISQLQGTDPDEECGARFIELEFGDVEEEGDETPFHEDSYSDYELDENFIEDLGEGDGRDEK